MNPFKAAKKFVKKVAKPIRKISQKFIPRELRWAAPYLAAVAPYTSFMMPGTGIMSTALGRSALSGLYNVAGQAIADPEGDDVNLLSTLLAGGQGYLTTPGMSDQLMTKTTAGSPEYLQLGEQASLADAAGNIDAASAALSDQATMLADRGLLTKAKDLGLTGASKLAGLAEGAGTTLGDLASLRADPFTLEGAKAGLQAITPALGQGTGDVAKAMGDKAMREWEAADAAEQAEIEATTTADEGERANLQMTFMRQAGHDEETIQETLELNDLGEYYTPPTESAAQGGIIGLKEGGMLNFGGKEMDMSVTDVMEETDLNAPGGNIIKGVVLPLAKGIEALSEFLTGQQLKVNDEGRFNIKKADGGLMNLGGKEMDMRGGGFIPIGKKERADDVPARLSKNEFVMTADAVRAAGGGDVNKGAQRMYNVMNNLEARA